MKFMIEVWNNPHFRYDSHEDTFVCDEDTFAWWTNYFSDLTEAEELADALRVIDNSKVEECRMECGGVDLGDQPSLLISLLAEAFSAGDIIASGHELDDAEMELLTNQWELA